MSTLSRQNCCSTCEIDSVPLSAPRISGGPPHSADGLSSSPVSRFASTAPQWSTRIAEVRGDHRRDLDRLTINSRIELEVHSARRFRSIGFDLRAGVDAGASAWMADLNLRILLVPERVNLLLVHRQARSVPQVRRKSYNGLEMCISVTRRSGCHQNSNWSDSAIPCRWDWDRSASVSSLSRMGCRDGGGHPRTAGELALSPGFSIPVSR